jgi:hypothetical protein
MKTQRKLIPGQPGTKKWMEKYGEKLVCIRYRYDHERKMKLKTVEMIVEETPWEPAAKKIPANKIVDLRIRFGEIELGRQVKAAGGLWNREQKVWKLAYGEAQRLGLETRIIEHPKRDELQR